MSGFAGWVGSLQQRLDNWARHQRDLVTHIASPLPQVLPLPRWQWGWKWQWQWPWQSARARKEQLEEEYKRRKEQIQRLCHTLKAEDVSDLKDILSAMILSECVYKRPESEVIRCVNKFSADFGGQLVQLERLQASLDHVSHRYLLAESGDTIFASFIGTKHYKDMITDVNILQGPLFHEDIGVDDQQADFDIETTSNSQGTPATGPVVLKLGAQSTNGKKKKPAAHRGFLARAKGIPAVELYRLAKKKDRRLVLCGHSLGGAVAVLATLAILKVLGQLSLSSSSKSEKKKQVEVKCITFSQPAVGNAALRDYVHEKGWHGHFRTYCIPEDLIPRILSPAYFQQYRSEAQGGLVDSIANPLGGLKTTQPGLTDYSKLEQGMVSAGGAEGMSDALELSPLQSPLQRLSALVPLIGGPRPFHRLKRKNPFIKSNLSTKSNTTSKNEDTSLEPLALKEVPGAASMASVSQSVDIDSSELAKSAAADWRNRVPSLPSYVPFGQLFLLEKLSVEPLSASEYTLLTSMQSVLLELRDRFRSHTMRSYRARFQRIYDSCMCDSVPPNFSMERVPYLPHLQQWLGLPGITITEPGKVAEPLILMSATSLVPIGWTGVPGDKRSSPFKVDLYGYGLHLCTLVKAQINGQWCSASLEFASPLNSIGELPKTKKAIQRVRVRIGQPIQEPSWPHIVSAANAMENTSENCRPVGENPCSTDDIGTTFGARSPEVEGLTEVVIHCSSDFMTASKKVVLRLRRVRLLGLEGAGKTSLYYALLGQGRGTMFSAGDGIFPDVDRREGVAEGVSFVDPAGVNLQDLAGEVDRLKQELHCSSAREGSKKVDLVILVHNLAHKIPRLHQSVKPALSVLMDEVNSAKIPSILAITNKFAASADRRQQAAATVMQAYQMSSSHSAVVNSSTYAVHEIEGANSFVQEKSVDVAGRRLANLNAIMQGATQKVFSAPISLIQLPFRRKEVVLPVEGVKTLRELVNRVLLDHEDEALMELSREQLLLEMKYTLAQAAEQAQKHEKGLSSSVAASAVGASLGLVVALVAATASGLRKP